MKKLLPEINGKKLLILLGLWLGIFAIMLVIAIPTPHASHTLLKHPNAKQHTSP